LPELKSFSQFLTVGGGGQSVTTWAEVLGDGTIGGEEPLGTSALSEALEQVSLACILADCATMGPLSPRGRGTG